MHVLVTKSKKRNGICANTGIPNTVRAVEYPFAVFEYEMEMPSISLSGMMMPTAKMKTEKRTVTVNLKGCRFREVSAEYVNAVRQSKLGEPEWLHGEDD